MTTLVNPISRYISTCFFESKRSGCFVRQMKIDKKITIDIICIKPWLSQSGNVVNKWPIRLSSINPVIIAKTEEKRAKSITHHEVINNSLFLKTIATQSNKTADENSAIGKWITKGCNSRNMFS